MLRPRRPRQRGGIVYKHRRADAIWAILHYETNAAPFSKPKMSHSCPSMHTSVLTRHPFGFVQIQNFSPGERIAALTAL